MKYDKIKVNRNRETRKQRAMERVGSNDPSCVLCGEVNPHCITCGEDYAFLLERHHIAGRKYDNETVLLCYNCHRKISDFQKDQPEQQTKPPHQFERIGRFLLGLADLFRLLIEKLEEFGLELIALASAAQTTEVGGAP